MSEMRSFVRVGDTLYFITTGNSFRGCFETVVFSLHGNDRRLLKEVHREHYREKTDAVRNHMEIFNSLKECI